MTERCKDPVAEAVDQFLKTPQLATSLGASVPQDLKVILKNMGTILRAKEPDRKYTAREIITIAQAVYDKSDKERPKILGNARAFGRYLQKHGGRQLGFQISGSIGNTRTYQPLSRIRSSLDS